MGKISEDDKNKVRNFTTAVLPEIEKIREHIAQCGLNDRIVSIDLTRDGYIRISFNGVSGASVYRRDIVSNTMIRFEEVEDVPV